MKFPLNKTNEWLTVNYLLFLFPVICWLLTSYKIPYPISYFCKAKPTNAQPFCLAFFSLKKGEHYVANLCLLPKPDERCLILVHFFLSVYVGATHLSSSLSKAHRGLVKLSLSHCGLTGKGVAQIGHALALNKCMSSSLLHLDLSSNSAKDDINVS